MNRLARLMPLALCFAAALLMPRAAAAQYYQTDFPAEEFRARHAQVFEKIGDNAVAVVQGVHQTEGFTLPRQHNTFYYLSGIETPGAYLLLDGRTKKVTIYLPPRNARLEAAEGRVLSADDGDLVKQISGVDDVQPLQAMTAAGWPLITSGRGRRRARRRARRAAGRHLRRVQPGREPGPEPRRAAIGRDRAGQRLLGRHRLAPAPLRRAAARAAAARRRPQPQPDPRRDAEHQEPARDRPAAARLADRRPRRDGSDAQHRTGRHRVSARRRRPLRLPRQRRPPRRLPLDHRLGHRQHQQHALLPQHVDAEGRRPRVDGLRAGPTATTPATSAASGRSTASTRPGSASCSSSSSSIATP